MEILLLKIGIGGKEEVKIAAEWLISNGYDSELSLDVDIWDEEDKNSLKGIIKGGGMVKIKQHMKMKKGNKL